MTLINEIVPGIFTWSEFSDEKQLNFNGYYIARNGESVLIDPPAFDDSGMEELQALLAKHSDCPLKAILLTNVHHDRTSRELKEKFLVPVHIHEKDARLLEFPPDKTFVDGEVGFCGLQVIHLNDQKSPGESAFLLPDSAVLIVGDALIGKVPGKVDLLPPEKYKNIQLAKEGLRVLLDRDFETLLVGDGDCILKNAKKVVEDFLQG
ncbi:MAG: MBL fold metallo-hydrolase [Nitrospinae bacterium]|jgi:glyoxylase-like metal-dependent hydrolase (beta-lactamase superfamily II)|nr:MBL fold metallo-hydrolase [Nitrospinota bacterium]MDA1110082.1 MBL fold metallo-hydrolase [Nitrospinota bacterium]